MADTTRTPAPAPNVGKRFPCPRVLEWPAARTRAILSAMPDLTERVPAERRAALLASLARSIAASLDLDTILQTVAEGARELCRSDLSAIALREPDTGDMVFRFRAGVRLHDGDRLTVQAGRGAGGRVLDTGKPFRSDDLSQEPAFADDAGYREIVKTECIVTVMVVPITIGERIEGLLYVDNRTARPFTDHDEVILTELADHAAIAIRNVRLLAREQRAREEAEARQPHEGRVPRHALPRAAHAAQRRARLGGDAAHRAPRSRRPPRARWRPSSATRARRAS